MGAQVVHTFGNVSAGPSPFSLFAWDTRAVDLPDKRWDFGTGRSFPEPEDLDYPVMDLRSVG